MAFVTGFTRLASTKHRNSIGVCPSRPLFPHCPCERKVGRGIVRMNFGGGFLGVGPAEVFVVVLVGWVVLGPRELIRVSKQVGSFIGTLRSAADDAKNTLTQALEVDALEEEYNKTVDAFRSGYEDGASGKTVSTKDGDDKDEEENDGKREVKSETEVVKLEEQEKADIDADEDDSNHKLASELTDVDADVDEAASRFQDQLRRLNDEAQVPPTTANSNGILEDLSIDADGIRAVDLTSTDTEELLSIELEYIDEKAKLELEQLDRKYAEMRKRILDKKEMTQNKLK